MANRFNGLAEVAEASKNIVQTNPRTWIPIYYDVKTRTVTTTPIENWELTQLIRPCTEAEIEDTVRRCLWM